MNNNNNLYFMHLLENEMKCYFLSIIIIFLCPSFIHAQYRAHQVVKIPNKKGQMIQLYQESHALIIGVSDYDNWSDLKGVTEDVKAVKSALEMNGFQTEVIENPTSNQLKREIKKFIYGHGSKKDNRLLFYLAGHGKTLTLEYNNRMGYFVPTDAPIPEDNMVAFMEKAIDMGWFELYAEYIQAKHALFLFDSCFAGSIFEFRGELNYKGISEKIANPVRQFITSGKADEKVPDESIFREQFIIALNGNADSDGDGFVTGTELGIFLQREVKRLSRNNQTPQHAKILNRNLNKGDFVFQIKKSKINISFVWKNVQREWNKFKNNKKIDCNYLKKFIIDFEDKQRKLLKEAANSDEKLIKVDEIYNIVEKLTDKINNCKWGIGCQCK